MIKRFKSWILRLRRRRAAKRFAGTPLREFVYLDDVSVYSLIASRLGAIAKEFTDTESLSLRAEVGGTVGANAHIAKSELTSKLESNQTQQSQVVRKSIIQSTFRELYESEKAKLVLSASRGSEHAPRFQGWEHVAANRKDFDGWLVPSTDLVRGSLVELEVALEAEQFFRLRYAVDAIFEIMQESPTTFERNDFEQYAEIQRIMDRLLFGLVPVEGSVIDYCVLEHDSTKWLAHQKLVEGMPESIRNLAERVKIVGVTEERLYWKDIRRVLFSNSRFRILCRLALPGLQSSWTPIKLADMLRTLSPEFADRVVDVRTTALSAMQAIQSKVAPRVNPTEEAMESALTSYAHKLAGAYGQSLSGDDLAVISDIAQEKRTSSGSIEEVRSAFGAVAKTLMSRLGVPPNPDQQADLRRDSLGEYGLDFEGRPTNVSAPPSVPILPAEKSNILEAEIVAIYW